MALIKFKKQGVNAIIDYDAMRRAAKILALKHKVRVSRSKENKWWGSYDPLHVVTYTHCVPRDEISYVLWHELGHAMQCERDYDSDATQFNLALWPMYAGLIDDQSNPTVLRDDPGFEEWERAYYQIPCEAEAEDIAERYATKYPLTK